MKAIDIILKLAKVSSPEELYKKYRSEEEFMKVHGKEFKEALNRQRIEKAQVGSIVPINQGLNYNIGANIATPANSPLKTLNQPTLAPMQANTPQASEYDVAKFKDEYGFKNLSGVGNILGNVAKGVSMLKAERNALKEAKQMKKVTDVGVLASQTRPEDIQRKYVRPEDITNTGEEFFPVYGVGTNVLAKSGAKVPKAKFGETMFNIGSAIGTDNMSRLATGLTGGESAGSAFGEAAADAFQYIPGVGPVTKMFAKPVFKAVGNILDTNPEKTEKYNKQALGNFGKMSMANGMTGLFQMNNKYMRTGGNLSKNTGMEENGELQFANGGAEQISNNPYGEELIEFNGPSHNDGGITMSFGNSPVEVEGGETAMKVNDGTLNIFGNMKAPGYGKTFKAVSKEIAKKEQSLTKTLDKSMDIVNNTKVNTPFDKLKFDTAALMSKGANIKLKKLADEKQELASIQNAMKDTAEEFNLDAEALSKGKFIKAKNGAYIKKAQSGDLMDWYKYMNEVEQGSSPHVATKPSNVSDKVFIDIKGEEDKKFNWKDAINKIAKSGKTSDVIDMLGTNLLPYLRPSNTEPLNIMQLLGEMSAFADKEEPVHAQFYQPDVSTPYDVSFQDQLNEIDSQTRAAQRFAGYNPAAQAIIAAQAYGPKSNVLAEQFRANQAMRDRVYGENRNLLNQAKLQNLGIADTQYQRQAQAKSNTKAVMKAALDSISDKYMKNKLENRTLATYENLYDYRFDPKFRAWYMGAPAKFDIYGNDDAELANLPTEKEVLYRINEKGEKEPVDIRNVPRKSSKAAKNGGIVSAIHKL